MIPIDLLSAIAVCNVFLLLGIIFVFFMSISLRYISVLVSEKKDLKKILRSCFLVWPDSAQANRISILTLLAKLPLLFLMHTFLVTIQFRKNGSCRTGEYVSGSMGWINRYRAIGIYLGWLTQMDWDHH